MEFTKGCDTLVVESYKGIVDFTLSSTWRDTENHILLSYAEWDDLVKAVEEYRAKEKENV